MRIHHSFWIVLLLGIDSTATAQSPDPKAKAGWISDGVRSCIFDRSSSAVRAIRCTQYHKLIVHKIKDGTDWNEYRWMWKGGNGLEVHYRSRIGIVGISTFTIGELYDGKLNLPGHMSRNAVSYSPSREELVIGVPAEGYEFSMKGGGL